MKPKTEHRKKTPSFDELDADQLKELIQSSSRKKMPAKPEKKTKTKQPTISAPAMEELKDLDIVYKRAKPIL